MPISNKNVFGSMAFGDIILKILNLESATVRGMRAGVCSTVIQYCPFYRATFEVLTAVLLEIEVFWYAKRCRCSNFY
jgi:hypothetical protein